MPPKDRWPELCELVASDDRLPVRDSGPWTEDKLYYWHRYIEITTRAMKTKGTARTWPRGLAYVDLFAGPGVGRNKVTGKRYPGSPLLAAKAIEPFQRAIFVESDPSSVKALTARIARIAPDLDCRIIAGDCNETIDRVVSEIPHECLTLAFVDPEGLQVRFETLRHLASSHRVDLLILFPVGYDIVRNIRLYELQDESKLDEVLGASSTWKTDWQGILNRDVAKVIRFITDEYRARLANELGYAYVDDVSIKHKGTVFYKLVYASMSARGTDFWRKAQSKERGGQMGLGF